MKARYADIHGQTMTPCVAHPLEQRLDRHRRQRRDQGAGLHPHRDAGRRRHRPSGATHYARAVSTLRQARALIKQAIDRFDAATGDAETLSGLEFQTAITMLKVEVSELAVTTVMSAMRANGLSGYRDDGDFTIGRHLRDILSAPIMIHNDRITANLTTATLMTRSPTPCAPEEIEQRLAKP